MSNLGVTPTRTYSTSEKEDYGWGLGQFQYTATGKYIFVKIGATTVAGTKVYVAPDTFVTGTTASGKLEAIPEVAHTYDSNVDAYAFVLVEGRDTTDSTEEFVAYTIVA